VQKERRVQKKFRRRVGYVRKMGGAITGDEEGTEQQEKEGIGIRPT